MLETSRKHVPFPASDEYLRRVMSPLILELIISVRRSLGTIFFNILGPEAPSNANFSSEFTTNG